jgi:hypothetical protein
MEDHVPGDAAEGFTGEVRKFDDEADAKLIRMRMIAMWEAEQTIPRAVSERYNPTAFPAWPIRRKETARASKGIRRESEVQTRWFFAHHAHPWFCSSLRRVTDDSDMKVPVEGILWC